MKKKILIFTTFCLAFTINSFSVKGDTGGQSSAQKIYLNSSDTINDKDKTKGQLFLHLSLPYINNFHLTPLNEPTKNNTGFMGYSIGLDYFYNATQYLNISFAHIQDFFFPIVFVDRGDEYELMSSKYLSLSNNHRINRFSFGYGLSFAKNSWELRNQFWDKNSSTREPVEKSNKALGLIFSSYYQTTSDFYIGIIYRPTFYRLNTEPIFKYEHSVSIDFTWKIPLIK